MTRPAPVDVTREVDRLFTLPLPEFTAARDELVRRLRALGAREAAEHVRRMRRPTLVAWTLNRLAHQAPEAVTAVLDAGAALRDAHDALLAGRPGTPLPEADAALAAALTAAVEAALAGSDEAVRGGAAMTGRLRATLRTAALDPEAGGLLREGHLERELEAPVLAVPAGAAPPVPPPPPAAAPSAEETAALAEALTAARAELDAAGAALREAQEARGRAAEAAGREAARRGSAEAALAAAEAERERAAEALREAERRRQEAAGDVDAARGAAEETEEGLRQAEERVAAARARLAEAERAAQALLG